MEIAWNFILSRFRNYLISSIGDLKRKTICVLAQIFPEYSSIFSDVFGKTSKEILMQINTPNDFEDISSSQLEKVLDKITLKKFAKNKIDAISKIVKTSFGVTFGIDSSSFQLKLLIEQISFIENQVTNVEKEIKNILIKINSPITTVLSVALL